MSKYKGKIIRPEKTHKLRKLLGALIYCPRKLGRPQNLCNNNLLAAIAAIAPETKKMANSRAGHKKTRISGTPKSMIFREIPRFILQ